MKEAKAMAYVNMYGVLGTLENLCAMDNEAKKILSELKKPVSLCFSVKDGPCCTFHFTKEGCRMTDGDAGASCKMRFASPEKFNDLIDSSKPGMPVKNPVQVLSFPLGPVTNLTARLTTNYRCLKTIYSQRKNHRLPEWRQFCEEIKKLPYAAELITGEDE